MDFASARRNMVRSQILPNRVVDEAVVEAMADIPRERFVPKAMQGVAYIDEDLPIAEGRYLMDPQVASRLLQAASIRPEDVVLEIGCGSGYLSAVLSKIANTVVGVDFDERLIEMADGAARYLGIDNAAFVKGALEEGAARQGPFDVIVFGGAVSHVPEAILTQLAKGGRLVAVLRADPRSAGKAYLMEDIAGTISRRQLFDANTPYLPGFAPQPAFEF